MSQITSTTLFVARTVSVTGGGGGEGAVRFSIEPLSTNADGAPVMGDTLGTEDGNRLPEHCTPTRCISFVSRHRRTGTEFPPSL